MTLNELSRRLSGSPRFWVLLALCSVAVVMLFQLFRVQNPITIQELLMEELSYPAADPRQEISEIYTVMADSLLRSGANPDSALSVPPVKQDSVAVSRHYFREAVRSYNAEAYPDALFYLRLSESVIPHDLAPDEMYLWYAAQILARNGRIEEALSNCIQVYQMNARYSSEAFLLAKKIMYDTGITQTEVQAMQPASL